MREELFQLQGIMVYGNTDINFSCNNAVEMKGAFQVSTDRTFKKEFKMGREHLRSLQLRENMMEYK